MLRRRKKAKLYQIWPEARPSGPKGRDKLPWRAAALIFLAIFTGGMTAVTFTATPESDLGQLKVRLKASAETAWNTGEAAAADASARFGYCHTGGGYNCVVDGDTFWMEGVKIRVADIDAPETHPPRCPYEADLGNRATNRLHDLLNQGPVVLKSLPDRDEDRYGRKLRIVMRDGHSLGDQLVGEGLARTWSGRREPWC